MRFVLCGDFWFLRFLQPVRYAKNRNKNPVQFQRIGWKFRTVCVCTGGERASAGKSDEKQRVTSVTYSKVRTISRWNTAEKLARKWWESRETYIPYGVCCNPDRYFSEVSFETTKRNGPVRWEKQTRTVFRDAYVENRRRKYNPVRYMHKKSRTVVCKY